MRRRSIYLDQARVGGQIHYLMESLVSSERYYFADLDNLGAVHRWTPQVLYINLGWSIICKVLRTLQQGGRAPYVLHFATVWLSHLSFTFIRLPAAIEILISRSPS